MKTISLKHGWIVLVDDQDFEMLSGITWAAKEQGGSVYVCAKMDCACGAERRHILMHRYILGGLACNLEVDHINGTHVYNIIDNQRSNLRVATRSLNSRNRGLRLKSKSGICGVRWVAARRRWIAVAYPNSQYYRIGSFLRKDEAISAVECWKASVGYRDVAALPTITRPTFHITCPRCGTRKTVDRSSQKFCSKRCRQSHWEQSHAKSLGL